MASSGRKLTFTTSFSKSEDKNEPLPVSINLIADQATADEIEKILLKLPHPIRCHGKGKLIRNYKTQVSLTFHYKAEDVLSQTILNIVFVSLNMGLSCGEINPVIDDLLMSSSAEESIHWVRERGGKIPANNDSSIQQSDEEQKCESLKVAIDSTFFGNKPLHARPAQKENNTQYLQTTATLTSLKRYQAIDI